MSKVYICGAGCLDASWLIQKAVQVIQQADCILYDDLLDPAILDLNSAAEKIFVGKRKKAHHSTQEEIQQRLLECAQQYTKVVRLKGGDPFVFGRGYEEAEFLKAHQIPYEIIPGISSCIGILEKCGIPITARGVASSFMVLSAHTRQDSSPIAELLQEALDFHGTLVILMGLSKASQIQQVLLEAGWNPQLPAAICYTRPDRQVLCKRGELQDLSVMADKAQTPAILVIGPAAALNALPAGGARVNLTGTPASNHKLAELLEPKFKGVTAQELQVEPLEAAISADQLRRTAWIVFASQEGVRQFFKLLSRLNIDLRALGQCQFACVGTQTAAVLKKFGFHADLISSQHQLSHLANELNQLLQPGLEILSLRSAQGSSDFEKQLEPAFKINRLNLYTLNPVSHDHDPAAPLVFMSSFGARSYFKDHSPDDSPVYSIGPATTQTLHQLGVKKVIQSDFPDLPHLAAKIKE